MEAKVRHDLRHPVATISMIASTMAAFGDGIDEETVGTYRAQIEAEVASLAQMARRHRLALDLTELRDAADRFCSRPDGSSAKELDRVAVRLVEHLALPHHAA